MNNEKIKILVVDDEADIISIIRYNLDKEGYITASASNGEEAIIKAKEFLPDLIILDIMMPDKNGMETMDALRKDPSFDHTRILFLTARGGDRAEIEGLNHGADDYIVKPIKPALLLSRINALLRRSNPEAGKVIHIGNMIIDRNKFRVTYNGNEITLARKEFELLALLASIPGKVFLRQEILNNVWGSEVIVGDRTIDVHIRKIRKKTGDIINTVKGVGYSLNI